MLPLLCAYIWLSPLLVECISASQFRSLRRSRCAAHLPPADRFVRPILHQLLVSLFQFDGAAVWQTSK